MLDLVWLIPALPLAGFLTLLVLGRRLGDPGAGWLATLAMGGSFAATAIVFVGLLERESEDRTFTQTLFTWIPAGEFKVNVGLLADPLSVTMCLFVTGVGALIHLYAIGYMHGDRNFSKFFVYLNLFAFSMLMLVLGDNLLITFLGWEGVGACSYFLISFWFTDDANASAGKKAFVTNRVGDWGFMVGTFLVWTTVGSVNYLDISASAAGLAGGTATAITVLFFVAAAGKSAQLPLFVWLPDAMAGPTPVSALIHAATMVTSGVYLLVRLNPVLHEAGWANDLIAWVGAITALVAATIAVSQNDIKKVLAYSTVSQLGYMFLAVGTFGYVAAVFHMVTHAAFKALLFLGSGSVIHGMHGEQDMRRMGGLMKYLPITGVTFVIGWLAIAGVPPFAGFWSKDEILAGAWEASPALWLIGLVTALLTAFYMSRQVFMTFFGPERWRTPAEATAATAGTTDLAHAEDQAGDVGAGAEAAATTTAVATAEHDTGSGGHGHAHGLAPDQDPHESPWTMTLPLVVLAGLSIVEGALNLPFASGLKFLEHWLEPVVGHHEAPGATTLWTLAVIAILAAVGGIAGAVLVYVKRRLDPERLELEVFARGWFIDESYTRFMGGPGRKLFELAALFDRRIVDGAVNGIAGATRAAGGRLRALQSGLVRTYAVGMALGAVLLLAYFLTKVSA